MQKRDGRHGTMRTLRALAIVWLGLVPGAAEAQSPIWSFRIGGGALMSSGTTTPIDADTTVRIGKTQPVVTFDVIRDLDRISSEFVVSASLARVSVYLSDASQTREAPGGIAPDAIQIGFQYKIRLRRHEPSESCCDPKTPPRSKRPGRQWVYVGGFVGGYARDRSASVTLSRDVVFTFPGKWGIGFAGGYRYRLNDQFSVDAGVKWQHMRVPIGERGSLVWNPVTASGGLVIKLY